MQLYQFPKRPEMDAGAFCMTPAAAEMLSVVGIARAHRFLGAIVGAPGVGKTTALQHYAEEHAEARYCSMDLRARSMTGMMRIVCEAVSGWPARSCAEMHEMICDSLRHRGVEVLLVDEAQFLSEDCLDQLRCIFDQTGTPIVFAGNHALRARVNGGKETAFAQFASRIGVWRDLRGTTAADVDALAGQAGVAEAKALAWLRERCTGAAGMRTASQLLPAARKLAGADKIRLAHLEAAARACGRRA